MKTLKLKGRYNTFSNSFNKARIYFTMADELVDVIADLYQLCLATGEISINGSKPSRCEIAEMSIKGRKSTIVFYVDVDEASLNSIAKHAFDRTIEISLTYREDKPVERVSGKYYAYLINMMERVKSAVNLGSIEELRYLINETYGYPVPINEHMRDVDAKQLEGLIKTFAQETIPGLDIPTYVPENTYLEKRRSEGKCTICSKPYVGIKDGISLCQEHLSEHDRLGRDKFMAKHYL